MSAYQESMAAIEQAEQQEAAKAIAAAVAAQVPPAAPTPSRRGQRPSWEQSKVRSLDEVLMAGATAADAAAASGKSTEYVLSHLRYRTGQVIAGQSRSDAQKGKWAVTETDGVYTLRRL